MAFRTALAATVAAASIAIAASPEADAGQFKSLYVFGDSYSDGGNVYALSGGTAPPSPPYDRRFSNGPTAVEYLAADLGIPFTYSLDPARGGKSLNYAVGGALTGTGNVSPSLDGTGLLAQVAGFKADVLSHAVTFKPSNSLFLLEGGGNDIFTLIGTEPPATIIADAAANIASEAATLYGLGARTIGIASLFHIGLTPDGIASGQAAGLNAVADALNLAYAAVVASLDATLPGADVFTLNSGPIINNLIANATAYGFTDSTDPCLDTATGAVCADPGQYVWWDDKHPTTRFHSLIGDALAAQVPEPATFLLVGTGLLGLGLVRRRRPV